MGRSIRFSIAGLMGAVLVAAIGLAALRNASETWAGVMLLLTCGVLALAVVGVVCRAGSERAWWLGFALFGWGYLALAFWSWHDASAPKLPTLAWLEMLSTKVGLTPEGFGQGSGMGGMGGGMRSVPILALCASRGGFGGAAVPAAGAATDGSYAQIGHCLWALLLAIVGGFLAKLLFGIPARRAETPGTETDASARPRWTRFKRPGALAAAAPCAGRGPFRVADQRGPGPLGRRHVSGNVRRPGIDGPGSTSRSRAPR